MTERFRAQASLLVLMFLTAGCAGGGWFRKAPPPDDVDFARRYLALFQSRSFAAIEMGMDPSLKDPQLRAKVMGMASLFPPGEPRAAPLVGWNVSRSGNATTSSLSFQYKYPGRWLLANVVVGRTGQATVVKSVQVHAIREPVERVNRASFAGKGRAHYAAAAVAAAVALLVLYALVLAVSTPAPGMKWAWVLFVIVGIVRFAFNWTTGTLTVVPMAVQVFGSGFTKASPFEPLVLTTSIPVGAIVYLVQRREWLQERRLGAQIPDVPDDPEERMEEHHD